MTTTECQYFNLLQSALWNTPVSLEGEIDWNGVMKIARHQANDVLISSVAIQMSGNNMPPDDMRIKMNELMRTNLIRYLQLKQVLLPAVELLRQHDIEPVLLKGFGLAMLYPNPTLRQFGDIDLYIGQSKFHEACALLRTLPGGYHWCMESDVGRHYNIDFGPHPLEIHRVSADVHGKDGNRYASIEKDGLEDAVRQVDFEGYTLSLPSFEFQVFFTFFHAWHHFLNSGVGWRQISDVATTLHAYHGRLDLDKLRDWLNAMHLMQPWQAFGYLMVEQLGLPQEEMPFYTSRCRRMALRLYRRIMEEGNFKRRSNFKRRKPKEAGLKRKLHGFIGIFVDFFYRAQVFPAAAFREMNSSLARIFGKFFKK